MGVAEELQNRAYKLEYEYGDGEDHTEVWINEEARMAVRVGWMKIEETG